jgi:hypothetical protein
LEVYDFTIIYNIILLGDREREREREREKILEKTAIV